MACLLAATALLAQTPNELFTINEVSPAGPLPVAHEAR